MHKPSLLLTLLLPLLLCACATQKVPFAVALPCRVIPPPPADLMAPPQSPAALTKLSQALSPPQAPTPSK